MLERLLTISFVLISSCSVVTFAQSRTEHTVSMAIGEPGSESFVFGTELWAMSQIALKPGHGIDLSTIEVAEENERLALLSVDAIEVALVNGNVPKSLSENIRTVLTLWPEGTAPGNGNPAQILARNDVPDDVIYRITRGIFENNNFFHGSKKQFGKTVLDQAMVGADLPIHPGAFRYYVEKGAGPNPAPSQVVTEINTAKFENFDDEAMDAEERAQVAAACRQALDLGALSAVLGDLSSRGCEVYQSYLEDQKNAWHQKASIGSDSIVLPSGQGGPAIALDNLPVEVQDIPELSTHQRQPISNPRQPTM